MPSRHPYVDDRIVAALEMLMTSQSGCFHPPGRTLTTIDLQEQFCKSLGFKPHAVVVGKAICALQRKGYGIVEEGRVALPILAASGRRMRTSAYRFPQDTTPLPPIAERRRRPRRWPVLLALAASLAAPMLGMLLWLAVH